MTNPAFPHLVKIGCTGRHPATRCRELTAATGVPAPFSVAWATSVSDFARCEALTHAKLDRLRSNSAREFFACDVATARRIIEGAASALLRPWWWRLFTGWTLRPARSGTRRRRHRRGSLDGLAIGTVMLALAAGIVTFKPRPPAWLPAGVTQSVRLLERL